MRRLMNLPTWRRKKGSLYWKAFAMWMHGWLLVQRGECEVPSRAIGSRCCWDRATSWCEPSVHSATRFGECYGRSASVCRMARNEEVFYGGPSGSATRCNVQCERDGAVGWRQSRLRLCAWISNSRSWRDARKFVGGSNRSQQAGTNGRRRIGFYSLIEVQLLYL
jgi:hypothetical protein